MADPQTVWFFDGTGEGCEQCALLTGYSLAEPQRPHPNCDCPITQLEVEDLSGCTRELRDLTITECHDWLTLRESYENCDGDGYGTVITTDEDVVEQWDEGVRELAEAEGWSPPDTEDLDFRLGIARGAVTEVEYQVLRYLSAFQARVWLICPLPDGTTIEIDTGETASGSYDKNYEVRFQGAAVEPCNRTGPAPEDLPPFDIPRGSDLTS